MGLVFCVGSVFYLGLVFVIVCGLIICVGFVFSLGLGLCAGLVIVRA